MAAKSKKTAAAEVIPPVTNNSIPPLTSREIMRAIGEEKSYEKPSKKNLAMLDKQLEEALKREALEEEKEKTAAVEVISPVAEHETYRFDTILVSQISTGRNVRKEFNDDAMVGLIESVRKYGIHEPLLVMEDGDKSGHFVLIAGERRLRAAVHCDIRGVPCRIYPKLSDSEFYEVMISENVLRADLNPIEEADGLKKLIDLGMSQEELGKRIGRSQEWISERLSLLEIPEELQQAIIARAITPTHVKVIMRLKHLPVFQELVKYYLEANSEAISERGSPITVRDLESSIQIQFARHIHEKGPSGLVGYLYDFSKLGVYRYAPLGCDDCGKRCVSQGSFDSFCFDISCFQETLSKIKAEYENKKKADSLSSSNKVDVDDWIKGKESLPVPESLKSIPFLEPTSALFNNRPVSSAECVAAGCKKCDQKKNVCTDPECFKKKSKEVFRSLRSDSKILQQLVRKAIGDTINALSDEELIKVVIEHCFEDTSTPPANHYTVAIGKFFDADEKYEPVELRDKMRYIVGSWFKSPFEWIGVTQFDASIVKRFKSDAKGYGLDTSCFDSILEDIESGSVAEKHGHLLTVKKGSSKKKTSQPVEVSDDPEDEEYSDEEYDDLEELDND